MNKTRYNIAKELSIRKKTTKDDIYVKILKYANENPGFSFGQITNAFPDQKILIHREITQKRLFIEISPPSDKYMLSFESRFYLLEYDELNEARKSSRNAMFVAILSIVLTFLSIVYSFVTVDKVEVVNFRECTQSIHELSNKK